MKTVMRQTASYKCLLLLACSMVLVFKFGFAQSTNEDSLYENSSHQTEITVTSVNLTVLSQEFLALPTFWETEPFLLVGDWLKAINVKWQLQDDCLVLELSNHLTIRWTLGSEEVVVKDQAISVTPFRIIDKDLWLPLYSLARLLGLKVYQDRSRNQIKLLSGLQKLELKNLSVGWILEVILGYPLLNSPKINNLTNPNRAYADFYGTVLDIPPGTVLQSDGFVTAVRAGQFSSEPAIARIVVDVKEPAAFSLIGRNLNDEGKEIWKFLVQPFNNRKAWLGQIVVAENKPNNACLLLYGWFGDQIQIDQRELDQVVVNLPSPPLTGLEPIYFDGEGILNSVLIQTNDTKTTLQLNLNRPAKAKMHFEGNDIIALLIELPSLPIHKVKLIVVDAGHGGKDPGAFSPYRTDKPQLMEKSLTLDISLRLKRILEQLSYQVVMTRDTDTYVPLPDRVAIANGIKADVFISIHLNSYPKRGGKSGSEVYYWTPQSRRLAESIYRQLLAVLGRDGNGVRRRRLYVVRHTIMPSVLVEACYLNHPDEEELLRDDSFRERIATAVCQGIMDFFKDWRILERKGE